MKKLFFAIIALTALVACDKDDKDKKEDPQIADRTVLVYMAAENNLGYNIYGERYAYDDILEMKEGVKTIGNNHLVLYVDKCKDAVAEFNDPKPYMLHYYQGELKDSIPMEETITADGTIFESVARKAFTSWKAKSYGLVLWGHATGWLFNNDSVQYTSMAREKAYGGDTGDNTYNRAGKYWMNIPTLAKVLSNSNLPHLSFILADCCNFMCVESAYELRNVTDYIIGSPAEIPATGAPYNTVVPAMMEEKTFYISIVDRYFEQSTPRVPLSVVKTSEMENFATATRTTLKTMEVEKYPNMQDIIYYTGFYDNRYLYDMNHVMLNFAQETEYQKWKKEFDKAVIYKKLSTIWDTEGHVAFDFTINEKTYGGLSMFIPSYKLQRTDNKYIKKMSWYYAAGYNDIGWLNTESGD